MDPGMEKTNQEEVSTVMKVIQLNKDQLVFLLQILDDVARDFYRGELVEYVSNLHGCILESVTDGDVQADLASLKARLSALEAVVISERRKSH